MSIEVVRLLQLAANHPDVSRITVTVHSAVAAYLNNRKRRELNQLEQDGQKTITIRGSEIVPPEHLVFECLDNSGGECKVLTNGAAPRAAGPRPAHSAKPAVPQARGPAGQPEPRTGKARRRRGGRRRGGRGRRRSGTAPIHDGRATGPDGSASDSATDNDSSSDAASFEPTISDEGLEDRMPDAHNIPPLMPDEPTTEE
jgi:hypothetical protein